MSEINIYHFYPDMVIEKHGNLVSLDTNDLEILIGALIRSEHITGVKIGYCNGCKLVKHD